MAREVNTIDAKAQTQRARPVSSRPAPRSRGARPSNSPRPATHQSRTRRTLAGHRRPQASEKHVLAAHHGAWGDGEPYVRRYELTKATSLLTQLGVEIPNMPPYDPAKDEKFPWEDKGRPPSKTSERRRKPRKTRTVRERAKTPAIPHEPLPVIREPRPVLRARACLRSLHRPNRSNIRSYPSRAG